LESVTGLPSVSGVIGLADVATVDRAGGAETGEASGFALLASRRTSVRLIAGSQVAEDAVEDRDEGGQVGDGIVTEQVTQATITSGRRPPHFHAPERLSGDDGPWIVRLTTSLGLEPRGGSAGTLSYRAVRRSSYC